MAVDSMCHDFGRQPIPFVRCLDRGVLNGHLKEALQYAASDEELAASMLYIIRPQGGKLDMSFMLLEVPLGELKPL